MLTKTEATQLFTALIKAQNIRVNGESHTNTADILDLVATFCHDRVKITKVEVDGHNGFQFEWK